MTRGLPDRFVKQYPGMQEKKRQAMERWYHWMQQDIPEDFVSA